MRGMYRPPVRPPRGSWALFLHRQRRKRNWSQQQAFQELREGLRLSPASRASYVALDMGDRQPRPAEAAFLTEFFDASPDAEADPEEAMQYLPPEVQAMVAGLDSNRQFQVELLERLEALTKAIERAGLRPPPEAS